MLRVCSMNRTQSSTPPLPGTSGRSAFHRYQGLWRSFCCWPIMLSAEGKPQFCGIFFMLVRTRMLGVLLSVRGHMKLHLPYKNTCQNDNCWCLWVKAPSYLINEHIRLLPSKRIQCPLMASNSLKSHKSDYFSTSSIPPDDILSI